MRQHARGDNNRDCAAKGRGHFQQPGVSAKIHVRGTAHPSAKLKVAFVHIIRALCSRGVEQRAVAEMLGVHQSVVWNVLHERTWKHVPWLGWRPPTMPPREVG